MVSEHWIQRKEKGFIGPESTKLSGVGQEEESKFWTKDCLARDMGGLQVGHMALGE